MSKFPKPRRFYPKNSHKYTGDASNIVSRSSWETQVMIWLDTHPGVVKWSSEEVVVPYYSPVDFKAHRYFPDFKVHINENGKEVIYLVEVKPRSQTQPPKMKKKQGKATQGYINEVKTYVVNTSKFEAAEQYCQDRGWKFMILTETNIKKI